MLGTATLTMVDDRIMTIAPIIPVVVTIQRYEGPYRLSNDSTLSVATTVRFLFQTMGTAMGHMIGGPLPHKLDRLAGGFNQLC